MGGKYFLERSLLEKYVKKTAVFPGSYDPIGNAAWAATAGLGSLG